MDAQAFNVPVPVMKLQQFMSRRLVTIELDDSLAEVKRIFDHMKFHHLLVVEDERLYGVVSDRDLLAALSPYIGSPVESPRDLATLNKRAHHVMVRKPPSLGPEASIADAVALFLAHDVSCIPVVDSDQRPLGIVTWRDLLRVMADPDVDRGTAAALPAAAT